MKEGAGQRGPGERGQVEPPGDGGGSGEEHQRVKMAADQASVSVGGR